MQIKKICKIHGILLLKEVYIIPSSSQVICRYCLKQYREGNKEKIKKWRLANKNKVKEYAKKYREKNREKLRNEFKERYHRDEAKYQLLSKKKTEKIVDSYAKALLFKDFKIPLKEVPLDLIEAEKMRIKLKRMLRKIKKDN